MSMLRKALYTGVTSKLVNLKQLASTESDRTDLMEKASSVLELARKESEESPLTGSLVK